MDAFRDAGSGLGDGDRGGASWRIFPFSVLRSGGLTGGGDVLGFMKRRLRRYDRPSSVCTWYDLGVLLGAVTWAGVHLSPFESWTWTLLPGFSGGRWCTVQSWYIFCVDCACCLLAITSVGLTVTGRRCLAADGRMDRSCLPISNCAGDARLSTGVEGYSSSAKRGSLPSAFARGRMFFALWTVFLAWPLDCGYPGMDVTCRKSQEAANAANSSAANWGPLLLTTTSGMPWRAKWLDSFLMTAPEVEQDVN